MTKEQQLERLITDFGDAVTGKSDLLGDSEPSKLFFLMVRLLRRLLSCNPDKMISKGSIRIRKILHPLLLKMLPLFLEYEQVFESKKDLLGMDAVDQKLKLTKESVIWCPNHGFKDDVAASIAAVGHAYILFGSLPMLFNTFDGVGAYINGIAICNRKTKSSKKAAMETSKRLLNMGMDMLVFPEGVWNKTPDKLMLDFWSGAYRLARETGSKIVPVIHYLPDPHKQYEGNVIHKTIMNEIVTKTTPPLKIEGRGS